MPLIVYCLVVYIQSSRPFPEQLPHVAFFDKILHFAAYGLMGALFFRAYQTLFKESRNLALGVLSACSAALYGLGLELYQHFIPYRHASSGDMIANLVGSVAGAILAYRMNHPDARN
jgi:VanZ family protein